MGFRNSFLCLFGRDFSDEDDSGNEDSDDFDDAPAYYGNVP